MNKDISTMTREEKIERIIELLEKIGVIPPAQDLEQGK